MPGTPTTPIPLPQIGDRLDPAVRSILFVGGTFDPVHKGHVNLPLLAARHLEQRWAEPKGVWLLFVPAARSPHKQHAPCVTDAQRIEMLTLATTHLPRCAVWTDEIDRAAVSGGPSYTVDTLERLRAWLDAHGGEDVRTRLLIGADQARALDRWRNPQRILELAEPLVMARGDAAPPDFPQGLGDWSRRFVPTPKMDVSSEAVRAALAAGDTHAAARMLDAPVLNYILANGLYQPGGSA